MKRVALAIASVGLWVAASAGAAPPSTLYDRLGGAGGVAAISTALIEHVADDPRLGRSFDGTNRRRIAEHLAEQLCELAGGPCHYDGDPMRAVHAGHDISEAEFYGMVEALEAILRSRGIGLGDRNRLLRLLAPMKRDVVNIPAASP